MTELPEDIIIDLEQLNKIKNTLSEAGYDSYAVHKQPARVLKMVLNSQVQKDFRDSYLAALAGGANLHVAETRAENSVKMFRERRTESG